MWPHEQRAMLNPLAAGMVLFALVTTGIATARSTPPARTGAGAAASLSAALDHVDRVAIHFVTRTGNYTLRGQAFKDAASLSITRRCGANCNQLMHEVVVHIQTATATTCTPGQENVLVEIGKETSLLYSHSGRNIEFEGKCYFNPTGIGTIVRQSDFIFQ